MIGSQGLRGVKRADLVLLLKAIHREELPCPITQTGLAIVGLLRLGDELGILRYLDETAVRAVLVSVIAERRGPGST